MTKQAPIVDADDIDVEVPSIVRKGPSMKNAPRPTDRKKSKAQREAEAPEFVTIDFGDHEFDISYDPDDWPVRAVLAFEEGKAASAVRALLGKEQWEELMEDEPTVKDLSKLFELIAEETGMTSAGN